MTRPIKDTPIKNTSAAERRAALKVVPPARPAAAPQAGCTGNAAEEVNPHPYQYLDRIARAIVAHNTGGVSPFSIMQAWSDWLLHLGRAPGRQLELSERAVRNLLEVLSYSARLPVDRNVEQPFKPKEFDHRFGHASWSQMPFSFWKQSFLATQDWWDHATGALRGVSKDDTNRVNFMIRQYLDLFSPSNFPATNPEIIEETSRRKGENIVEGARHFIEDVVQTWTQRAKEPPEGLEIGKDIACTPGKVVYRNDIFELIQYSPATPDVQAEPVLLVPAWIMKYYILDLSPHNSLVRFLVDKGFTVFAMSWCNPTADQASLSLDDYRKRGVMEAIDAITAITCGRKVHATGYCLGGTILGIAASTMARDGDDRLASVSLFAAQVDFSEAGELLLFLDESQVAFLEDLMWAQGYLDRPQMTRTFATIRAEDLIYTRAVRRYFLGKEDLPTDLTVWNNDTTRMPARMHGEYLRALFLENRLSGGRFAVEGRVVALKDITAPAFVVGTEKDHIAPWRSVYKIRLFTDCELTFVLTSSGHNGGVLSEPGHPGRYYRTGERRPGDNYVDPDTWCREREPVDGSWWNEWADWLAVRSSGLTEPPEMGGPDNRFPAVADAPGHYIFQK
ncbi:PHA/PHB synthase family protein [Oricola cellulosilytica]|uniref:Alpha/beta fold hydrolase n=1 Tax=Oricola cellulosilytica TaxID=1429082 RepID=A0A4R0PDE9_9HYPH|nr:alpha/beta fold hydrolase [Oricola cellulosilytica]TCD13233.1 alpha/beta fold hydrolase [Oricola cellulosilytica]